MLRWIRLHFASCHLGEGTLSIWCIRLHFGLCHLGGATPKIRMHFGLCHPAEAHGTHVTRTLYFTGQECTLVYVTPLKPMSPGHCALCFISHGYCASVYKNALYVTPLMAGGVLLPHPSISSSLCNQPGLHCCTALDINCTAQ